jgi:hypothetical protein
LNIGKLSTLNISETHPASLNSYTAHLCLFQDFRAPTFIEPDIYKEARQGLRSAFLTREERPRQSTKFRHLRKAGLRTPSKEFRSVEQDRVSGFNAKPQPWRPFVYPLSCLT